MTGKDKANMVRSVLLLALLLLTDKAEAARRVRGFEKAPHNYWTRPLADRFTQFKTALESGKLSLERSREKALVVSQLKA